MTEESLPNLIVEHPENEYGIREAIEKFVSLAIPVRVTPKVEVKPVHTEACGKPIITPTKHGKCDNFKECGDCEFMIIQKMKLEIPVSFRLKTDIKDAFVDCELRQTDIPLGQ